MILADSLADDWAAIDRVVFHDRELPPGGTEEPGAVADTLQQSGGFRAVDRRELAAWLEVRARVEASGTLLLNTQGDSIPTAGLRAYIEAGGRLVWCGTGPSFLGLRFASKPPEPLTRTPPAATPEGVAWGLRPGPRGGDGFLAPGDAGLVLAGVEGWASIFLLPLLPNKAGSGLLRFGSQFLSVGSSWEDIDELMRVAAHGLGLGAPPAPAGAPGDDAAAAPAAQPPGEPGILVESGGFRVARAEALRKLMGHQLGDDAPFLLPWARAAAACGAREVEVRAGFSSIELSFDGEPLPARWAPNPFDSLFGEEPEAEPARQTAFGILGALKLRPSRVELETGRTRLVVSSPEKNAATELPAPAARTRLRAVWFGPYPGWPVQHVSVGRLLDACPIAPFRLRVNDKTVRAPRSAEMESVDFEEPGVRGVLFSQRNGWGHSRLGIHRLGVRVCEVAKWTWPAMVDGDVEAPGLTLNLSQTGVVRDASFDRMMAALVPVMFRLIDKVLERHSPALRRAAELVRDRRLDGLWSRLTEPRPQPTGPEARSLFARVGGFLGRAALDEGERVVEAAARPIWWLRRCSYGIPGDKALMDAPLWFSAVGGTLSRRRLEAVADELGYIPVASAWHPRHPRAGDVLRLVSEGDRRLSQDLYRRRMTPVDDELAAGRPLERR